jgi:hypothetical protein
MCVLHVQWAKMGVGFSVHYSQLVKHVQWVSVVASLRYHSTRTECAYRSARCSHRSACSDCSLVASIVQDGKTALMLATNEEIKAMLKVFKYCLYFLFRAHDVVVLRCVTCMTIALVRTQRQQFQQMLPAYRSPSRTRYPTAVCACIRLSVNA